MNARKCIGRSFSWKWRRGFDDDTTAGFSLSFSLARLRDMNTRGNASTAIRFNAVTWVLERVFEIVSLVSSPPAPTATFPKQRPISYPPTTDATFSKVFTTLTEYYPLRLYVRARKSPPRSFVFTSRSERLREFTVLRDLAHTSPAIIYEVRLDDLERISRIPRLPMGFAPGRSNNAP